MKTKRKARPAPKKLLVLIIITALAFLSSLIPLEGLTPASKISLMIFVAAAGLWITEVVPPFATAIFVIVIHIFVLGRPGGPLELDKTGYRIFLNPIASPVLVLFFGGFILALAAKKHNLDIRLAKAILSPFGKKPSMVLLGILITTALFSMFMSNTATTAMMIAIFGPLFKAHEKRTAFKKALVLAVPFAANIGGMGTIIGTPPNAVAASVLEKLGIPISFLQWMIIGVPIVILLLFILWMILLCCFKPRPQTFEILFEKPRPVSRDMIIVLVTFIITVLLWLTEALHGISASVVALFPVMIFTFLGVIDRDDINRIEWNVLILVAGGLVLGVAMKKTGLSDVFVTQISIISTSPKVILGIMVVSSLLIANFMSHTSAANLIIPLVASITVISPKIGIITIALTTSLAQSLPISTPPNAIAYSTRAITTKEMAIYGTALSVIGLFVMLGFLYLFRHLL